MSTKQKTSNKKKVIIKLRPSSVKKANAIKAAMRNNSNKKKNLTRPHKGGQGVSRIRGKGDYITDGFNFFDKEAPKSEGFVNQTAKDVGQFIGDKFGLGRQFSNAAGKLSRIFGFGDYKINHSFPVHKNSFTGASPPTFSNGKGEDVIICKREYIMDIIGSTDFHADKFFLNPGNPILFPWLSGRAKGYEEYKFLGMVFEFKSASSDAISTGGGLGTVIMGTDYDCLDNNFNDKRTIENSEYSNSAKPAESFLHPIECDPRRNVLSKMYVLPGVTDVSQITSQSGIVGDPRFDTLGQTYIATQGLPTNPDRSGIVIGELWVSYKVMLSRPVLESNASTDGLLQTIHMKLNEQGALIPLPSSKLIQSEVISGLGIDVVSTTVIGADVRLNLKCNAPAGENFYLFHASGTADPAGVQWHLYAAPDEPTGGGWHYDHTLLTKTDMFNSTRNDTFILGTGEAFNTPQNIYTNKTGMWAGSITVKDDDVTTRDFSIPVYYNTTVGRPTSYTLIVTGLPKLSETVSRVRNEMYKRMSQSTVSKFTAHTPVSFSKDEVKDDKPITKKNNYTTNINTSKSGFLNQFISEKGLNDELTQHAIKYAEDDDIDPPDDDSSDEDLIKIKSITSHLSDSELKQFKKWMAFNKSISE